MEVLHPRRCGIDVHQASLAVCVAIKEKSKSEKLRFGSTTAELLRLADWLHGHQVTHVAMEATGVYWKPIRHILEGQFELLLANPRRFRPYGAGRTTSRLAYECNTDCCKAVSCRPSRSSSCEI
jgi:transposase